MYKGFGGFERFENFSILEGIDTSTVEQNINTQNNLAQMIQSNEKKQYQNYLDISNNITSYTNTATILSDNNNAYHYNDKQDPNSLINNTEIKDIKSAINNDINELKLYQNSIYITGIIACATLLITAILISKK